MNDSTVKSVGYETRDIRVRGVFWSAVGLIFATAIIYAGVFGLFHALKHRHPSPYAPSRIALRPHMLAPPPQLQTDPAIELKEFETEEEAKLDSYGWIDKPAGIIRIPIGRAMDLIAQRGLPTRGPGTQNASGITAVQMQERKAAATRP